MKKLQLSFTRLSAQLIHIPRDLSLLAISFYQATLSPDHGVAKVFLGNFRCRFFPTCSEYAREAISQYGLLKGSMVSLKRILRCHPWNKGGYDPMPHRSPSPMPKD